MLSADTEFSHFYTLPHDSGGYYGFTLDIRVSIRLSVSRTSVFRFWMITCVNINGFSPNLVCALILWKADMELLMGKFHQIFTALSARDTPIFSYPDDNLSKHQWIFTKLGLCIDIVEIWFGIANEQISSNFDGVLYPRHAHIFVFHMITSKCQGILTKFGTCIDMKIWFGIAYGQRQCLTELSARNMIMAGYYSLTVLLYPSCSKNGEKGM